MENENSKMTEALGMTSRIDDEGILWVVFDRAGDKVNLLTAGILQELDRVLADLRGRPDLRGALFVSDKPKMFIAGMDVEQIAAVTDSHRGAEAARFGQSVFQKIADLNVPSVAAIDGPCLGGGTELALACTFRVASDSPSVKIGLPEVRLGIIPGFGGTQRLPRLIGLPSALDLILTGRNLSGKRAKQIGLVDAVVPSAYLLRESRDLLRRSITDGVASTARSLRRRLSLLTKAMETFGPLRRYALEQARKKTAQKADPKNYPAPFRAIEAVESAYTRPLPEGLDTEARIVGELIPGRTAKNLIWIFKAHNAMKGDVMHVPPRRVDRVAVLGAGIMGGGIAQLVADNDILVRLKDLKQEPILTALQTANGIWAKKLKRKRITRRELSQKMANISPTVNDSGFRHVDLVIEAVVENLEIKQQVLADLEQRIGERTVFATNTSSLPIDDIAARALRPERVVGMHFFNPVHMMPLVEVIAGRKSSPESVATVHALAVKMGKVPVVVKDGPGFLVNRILTFYINEALRLLDEGVRIDAADRAMKGFGMPMGPLALLDQIGLDTAKHVGDVLRAALGKRVGGDGNLLATLVAAGRLGKKNGRGFYRYRDGKPSVPEGDIYNMIGSPTPRDLPPETLQERMVLVMVNEAAICLEEKVVRQPQEVDVAMVMGTGFPPFRGGLLRHADSVGIPIVVDRLSRLAEAHGERFRPAQILQAMVREQRRFYSRG